MDRPRICAVITRADPELISKAESAADLYELRIDLVGEEWPKVASTLGKPWIATNRLKSEGGAWEGDEDSRRRVLLKALGAGASIVDVELATPELEELVPVIKKKARCLVSHHDNRRTPPPAELHRLIEAEMSAGADICKLVTTARSVDDNINVLNMMNEFRPAQVIAFGQGPRGQLSRLLCPLAGGAFAYASISEESASASGQLTVFQMRRMYAVMGI